MKVRDYKGEWRSRVKERKMLKIVISAMIVSIAYSVLVGIAATSLMSL